MARHSPTYLSGEQWAAIRSEYETTDASYAKLAEKHGLSMSSLARHAAADGWKKAGPLVAFARSEIMAQTQHHLRVEAVEIGKQVAARLAKDLTPWIEKEKRAQIQRAIRRSTTAQKRLDRVALAGTEVINPKTGEVVTLALNARDEMALSTAEEKHDTIIRRNLGMSETTPSGGSLSVRVLTGQVAVSVDTAPSKHP